MRCNHVVRFATALVIALGVGLAGDTAMSQYTQVTAPFNTLNDSFFENFGAGFSFNIPTRMPGPGQSGVVGLNPNGTINPNGINFNGMGANSAPPVFGGYNPNDDATLGFGALGGGFNAFFNFRASQGSNRSNITQAPTIVLPNGGQGSISDTTQVPFVTGVIPVVGGAFFAPGSFPPGSFAPGPPVSPLYERMNRLQQMRELGIEQSYERRPTPVSTGGNSGPSTAGRGDLSVAEIRAQQAAAGAQADRELAELIERGRGAEAAGKFAVAKHYYRMAAGRAEGSQQRELLNKAQELDGAK
jgi:hypothetical protein